MTETELREKIYLQYYCYISKEHVGHFELIAKEDLGTSVLNYLATLLGKPVMINEISKEKVEKFFKKKVFADKSKADYIASGLETSSMGATSEKISVNFNDAPVIRLVNSILEEAVNAGASDVHIEPQEKEMRTRYRIDGDLETVLTSPLNYFDAASSRVKFLAKLDVTQRLIPQDGKARVDVNGMVLDLRISTIPAKNGESLVIRILNKEEEFVTLTKLGVDQVIQTQINDLLKLKNGLILLTGPTGSGKSTTLYSMLKILNRPEMKIVTVEDPVEYEIEGVSQVEVNAQQGVTFPSVLRHFLRHDPDVIMVGEIRDAETARIAVQASLTGHLVLSTLHTNDTVSAITRLMDLQVEPHLIASSLKAVMAQRLVKDFCSHCKKSMAKTKLNKMVSQMLRQEKVTGIHKLFEANGCAKCRETGYLGRTAVMEYFGIDRDIKKLINEPKPEQAINDYLDKKKHRRLPYFLLKKLVQGETSQEEIERVLDLRDHKLAETGGG